MLKKLFAFDAKEMSLRTEIVAGVTTFLTMSYILAVHPSILEVTGMDKGALFTTTALVAAIATLLMAVVAKLPLGLAPGMGMNAMFAYTVCLMMGHTWQFALMAVLLEGVVFVLLTVFNLWDKIIKAIPEALKGSIATGIGMFIIFLGLKNAGVVVADETTLVRLGDLSAGSPTLALVGIVLTTVLYVKNVPGALLWGIVLTALIGIPLGETRFDGFFSVPPSIDPIFMKMDWSAIWSPDMLIVLVSFLFVDLFSTTGTIIGLTSIVSVDNEIKHFSLRKIFGVGSMAVTLASVMGTSAVLTYIESATGIKAGGRSGVTALVIAICFVLALFMAPFFLAIPSAATTPVLVLVGMMMMSNMGKIDFKDFSETVPALICIIMMTLSFSIADGIILGHLSYVGINLLCGNHKKISVGMYVLAAVFVMRFVI